MCNIAIFNSLQDNWSALLFAAKEGHDEIVADLLEHGATVDQADMVHN